MTEAEALSFQTKGWDPIPRISRTVPFGYEIDENDPDVLQPVVLELEALEKAKEYLTRFSARTVAVWLERTTGRYISHVGLLKRIRIEKDRHRKAKTLRSWARRIEEAKAKAEILEKGLGASSTNNGNDVS